MNTGASTPRLHPIPSTASPITQHPPLTEAKLGVPGHNRKMMKPVHQEKLKYRDA